MHALWGRTKMPPWLKNLSTGAELLEHSIAAHESTQGLELAIAKDNVDRGIW